MPNQIIIEKAVKVIRSIPGWPSLRVLDLSCGEGALLELLHAAGGEVEGTHYREDDYILKHPRAILSTATIHKEVDLTRRLPFDDQSYDVVIATEVIEHLPSHSAMLAEVSRILKPGGYFLCSTPNIHRLASRLQFALTGYHELRSARLGWHVPADALYSTHHNPVYLPVLHTLLHHNGLHIETVRFIKCSLPALLLIPLLPVVLVATAVETRHAIKRSRAGGLDLLRWMNNVRLLFSNTLFILARKSGDGPG
jgi:SAM-dependent methyltransferase